MLTRLLKSLADSDWVLRLLEVADRRSENRITEFGIIAQAMEFAKINSVRGDYFEFGLWQGKTFRHAYRLRNRYSVQGMKLRGFDSFQGLPEFEKERDEIWSAGQFAYGRERLDADLASWGLQRHDYELVAGFYDQSLDDALVARLQRENVQAAVVYIDCDLYESTRPVLRFLANFLQNGTIVCFDDYFNYKGAPDQGEARALSEFLAANPRFQFIPYQPYAPLGQSFIVRLA